MNLLPEGGGSNGFLCFFFCLLHSGMLGLGGCDVVLLDLPEAGIVTLYNVPGGVYCYKCFLWTTGEHRQRCILFYVYL